MTESLYVPDAFPLGNFHHEMPQNGHSWQENAK
jgi:hypothetical protein